MPAENEHDETRRQETNRGSVISAAFDLIPVALDLGFPDAVGRGTTAAADLLKTGASAAADGLGGLAAIGADLAGDAARLAAEAAGSVDLGSVTGVAGEVVEVAGEALGDVAGAVIEGLGSISS